MVGLRMVGLCMVPHGGVPAVVVHVSERHGRGCERSDDEDSKSLLENLFHGIPGGSTRVSNQKRCNESGHCKRRHLSALSGSDATG
ncbi:MAG: hypothetical protein QOI13_2700 [Paraburkholderia sp.]|nr:hypothetical protein [Paraburkholderia sp.]